MSENNTLETSKEPETPASHTVVGIRFRPCGKIYTFKVDNLDVDLGTQVVVESEMGLSLGSVARPKYTVEKTEEPLKKVRRVASEKDIETVQKNRALEEEAKAFCIEKAKNYNLEMKVVTTETTLDKKRLVFYFTADGRIDFRELVRDLAAKFKTRIEMRQIGVRDEVKLLGGIGACGRQVCCSLFLTSFEPITIRMAKQQELSINQSKLSGICGRLMCCLGYEFNDSDEKAIPSTIQDEAPVTIAAEPSEDNLHFVASDKSQVDEPQQEAICTCKKNISQDLGKETVTPQPGKAVEDKGAKRRRRRRRRRLPSSKASRDGVLQEKSESAKKSQEGEPQQTERKEKGKPFSRRRKFWRKKKH